MSISAIKEKLTYLTQAAEALKLFGADKHKFVSKKVPEYQIKWFEFKHQIVLPIDYRTFLLEIGYGAGPNFGIHSLNKSIEWLNLWNQSMKEDYSLNKNFELTTQDAVELINQKIENPKAYFDKSLTSLNGILPINYQGCTYHTYLVVRGEQSGNLWVYNEDDALTLPAGVIKQVTFMEWYNNWLNQSLEKIKKKTA